MAMEPVPAAVLAEGGKGEVTKMSVYSPPLSSQAPGL